MLAWTPSRLSTVLSVCPDADVRACSRFSAPGTGSAVPLNSSAKTSSFMNAPPDDVSPSRKSADLPEQLRVVEVDPGVDDPSLLHFDHVAPVKARLSPRRQDVGQRTQMGPGRAPADDHVAVAGGEDLLEVEVQIGKRRDVELEELASALVTGERFGEDVRLPDGLRVQPLDESLHVVRIPRREDLTNDVHVVLSVHRAPPPPRIAFTRLPRSPRSSGTSARGAGCPPAASRCRHPSARSWCRTPDRSGSGPPPVAAGPACARMRPRWPAPALRASAPGARPPSREIPA